MGIKTKQMDAANRNSSVAGEVCVIPVNLSIDELGGGSGVFDVGGILISASIPPDCGASLARGEKATAVLTLEVEVVAATYEASSSNAPSIHQEHRFVASEESGHGAEFMGTVTEIRGVLPSEGDGRIPLLLTLDCGVEFSAMVRKEPRMRIEVGTSIRGHGALWLCASGRTQE